MNINPSAAAASIAGTSRAAARGGEADSQAIESTRQQATADNLGVSQRIPTRLMLAIKQGIATAMGDKCWTSLNAMMTVINQGGRR